MNKNEVAWTFLDSANIITHSEGKMLTLDDLRTLDIVGIYFSAHWCPPCLKLTPKLAQLYKDIAATGKKFVIVFVSSDKDYESFLRHFRQMPWVALDYKEKDLQNMLGEAFRVESDSQYPHADASRPENGQVHDKRRRNSCAWRSRISMAPLMGADLNRARPQLPARDCDLCNK